MVSQRAIKWMGMAVFMVWLVGLCATVGQAAQWQVRTDRQPIHEEESFRLIFETAQEADGSPDFSLLERDFELLGKQQGSSFQSVNGQHSHKTSWTVTLLPRRAGTFTIPAIAFGRDHSPEYTVVIDKGTAPTPKKGAKQAEDLFLEVSTTPEKGMVQSQVIYTVRFFRSVEISGASLTEPALEASDAVVEKLGEDQTFETNRNGTHYLVVERRYALFPQRSGRLTVAPLRLEVQVGKRGLFSLFDDAFSAGGGEVKRRHSSAVELDVEPIPPSFHGASWLPAHRLQLMEKWSENPPKFQVGEAITRTLTLLADGLTSAQLPEIAEAGQAGGKLPDHLKRYPDQPTLTDQRERTGIIGTRQEKVAMVPSQPGSFVLPAMEIAWWNVDTQAQEVARIPERTIVVAPAQTTGQSPSSVTEMTPNSLQGTAPAMATSPTGKGTEVTVSDARRGSVTETKGEGTGERSAIDSGYPFWLIPFLAIGWALTLLAVLALWWRRRSASSGHRLPVNRSKGVDMGRLSALLKQGCTQNNPESARSALLAWARAYWPGQTVGHLNDLQLLLKRLQWESLAQEVLVLNRALFSPTPAPWSGQSLWDAVDALPKQAARRPTEEVLPPLYGG